MVTALIQFTQGANTDVAGRAVRGVASDFSDVFVANEDNADVVSWRVLLLDAPADSGAFPVGMLPVLLAFETSNQPSAFFAPDTAGTYRVMLEVSDVTGQVDRDIRCFGIPDSRGFIRPPYQENPRPLPLQAPPNVGADGPWPIKPDEQNYGGNPRGWAGDAGSGQLDSFMRTYDDLPYQVVDATPFSAGLAGAPLYLVDLPVIGAAAEFNLPESPRTGYVVRVAALGSADSVTILPQGGGSIGPDASVGVDAGASVTLVHQAANFWLVLARSGAGGATGAVAPVTVVSISSLGMESETFANLSVALEKDYPSSYANSAIYLIAPNLHEIPPGPIELETIVNYTLKSIGSSLGQWQVALPEMLLHGVVNIEGCLLQGDLGGGGGQVVLQNCFVGGNINVEDISAKDCLFPDFGVNVEATGRLVFKDCYLGSSAITCANTSDPVVEIYNSKPGVVASVTFNPGPGVVKMDAFSNYWWQLLGCTVTDGTIEVASMGATLQSITGGDLQDQINSVVDALVALGLATDDRGPGGGGQ